MRKHGWRMLPVVLITILIMAGCGKKEQQEGEQNADAPKQEQTEQISGFVGNWKYDESDTYLSVKDDGSWIAVDSSGNILGVGSAKMNGELFSLYNKYDESDYCVFSLENDKLKDYDDQPLSRVDSAPQALGYPLQEYYGLWAGNEFSGAGFIINIKEENSKLYLSALSDGEIVYSETVIYSYENGKICATEEDDSKLEFVLYEDGTLHMTGDFSGITLEKKDSVSTHKVATPFDEKEESFVPENMPDVTIHYPKTLGKMEITDSRNLWLAGMEVRSGTEHETDDRHSVIGFGATTWDERETKYLNMGEYVAKAYIQMFANLYAQAFFKDNLISAQPYTFTNGGDYYEIKLVCALKPGAVFADGYETAALLTIRYSDNKYMYYSMVEAPYTNLLHYDAVADSILDSVECEDTGWTTAGAEQPDLEQAYAAYQEIMARADAASGNGKAVAGSSVKNGSGAKEKKKYVSTKIVNNKGAGSQKGAGGVLEPFYWTDPDGYIWYWNGTETVGYGYSGDFYTDDGMLYESNDAGWDSELDYDYDYDYEPYSDPGDGEDAWSDPGDTDDYVIESDPGDGDDAWSDPGDTDDYVIESDPGDGDDAWSDPGDWSDEGDSYDEW